MYGLLKNEIEGTAPQPILALNNEFGDLELELTSVKNALDQADLDHTAEVRKLDAAVYYLYARVAGDRGPFTIADIVTAETVMLAMMRHANLTAAGAATADELEAAARAS